MVWEREAGATTWLGGFRALGIDALQPGGMQPTLPARSSATTSSYLTPSTSPAPASEASKWLRGRGLLMTETPSFTSSHLAERSCPLDLSCEVGVLRGFGRAR